MRVDLWFWGNFLFRLGFAFHFCVPPEEVTLPVATKAFLSVGFAVSIFAAM